MKRALQLVVALCSVGLILGMLVGRESLTTELAGVIGYSFFQVSRHELQRHKHDNFGIVAVYQVPPKSETGVSGYPKGLLEEKEPVMATKAPTPGLHKAAHAPAAINRTVVTVTFPEGGEQVNRRFPNERIGAIVSQALQFARGSCFATNCPSHPLHSRST